MRKFYFVGLALMAVFALGAFTASSALAVSQILYNTLEIPGPLAIEVSGNLLLEDTKAVFGKPDILCSGSFDGTIEGGGTLGFVTEVLNAAKELVQGAHGTNSDLLECTASELCANPVDVEVTNLPWHVEVELNSGAYLLHFLSGLEEASKEPTYIVHCKTLFENEDICEGLSWARLYVDAAGDLRGAFNELPLTELWGAASPLTHCSLGGAESGLLESEDAEGKSDTELAGGLFHDTADTGLSPFSLSE